MKFYTKTIISIILFTLATTSIKADDYGGSPWSIGFRGGLNISNKHNDNAWGSKTGYNAGIFADCRIYDFFFLRLGFGYNTKGAVYSNTTTQIKQSILIKDKSKLISEIGYLQIPLSIGVRINLTDNFAISTLLGAYVEQGISFSNTYERQLTSHNLTTGNVIDSQNEKQKIDGQGKSYFKKVDIGAVMGLEGEYKRMLFGINYERGFSNLSSKAPENVFFTKWKNRNGSIYVGYKFKL